MDLGMGDAGDNGLRFRAEYLKRSSLHVERHSAFVSKQSLFDIFRIGRHSERFRCLNQIPPAFRVAAPAEPRKR